jgi:hypothetical protein
MRRTGNNRGKRPVFVTLLAIVYMAISAIGFVYHFPRFHGQPRFQGKDVWIELTEATAFLSGIFLWQGRNWARWLALAWIVFHVVLSAFHTFRELIVHCVICGVIAWILFMPPGTRYFHRRAESIIGE